MDTVRELLNAYSAETWAAKLGTILFLAIVLHVAFSHIIKGLKKASIKTRNIWGESVAESINLPLNLVIWFMAIKIGVDAVALELNKEIFYWSNDLAKIAIIVAIAWFLLRLTTAFVQNIVEIKRRSGDDFDITTLGAVSKLIRLTITLVTTLIVLQNLGISISGLLAAGGVSGLVIGFAAKDLLANLFGGLTIYMDKPFKVGDWIRCDEKAVEGTVEYIGWRHTRVRAFNKNPIYIPNAAFTTVVVENPSRMTHRRLKEIIGLRYCDISKMSEITDEIRNMLQNHEEVDQNERILVNFTKFNDSSVDFLVNVLMKNTDWGYFNNVKHEILLKISDIIEKHGAEIAFPTRTVYLDGE